MAGPQPQPHAFLRSLFQQLEDLEPDFPSIKILDALGIQAFEVSLDPEKYETLQFDPSFFEPHHDKLLQKYPILPEVKEEEEEDESLRLFPIPSVQDIMNDSWTEYSPEVAPIVANLDEHDLMMYDNTHDALSQARSVEAVIERYVDVQREGPTKDFTLQHLTKQVSWFPDYKAGDPPFMQEAFSFQKMWRVMHEYRYAGRPRKPHSVMTCISHVYPTDANRGISTQELKAIVSTFLRRVNHTPFRECHIHPVLVFSYMGDMLARIIQASYDGKGLVLQYSQLWNFADEETAPVEFFVRYRLSEPVGGGSYTLSIR